MYYYIIRPLLIPTRSNVGVAANMFYPPVIKCGKRTTPINRALQLGTSWNKWIIFQLVAFFKIRVDLMTTDSAQPLVSMGFLTEVLTVCVSLRTLKLLGFASVRTSGDMWRFFITNEPRCKGHMTKGKLTSSKKNKSKREGIIIYIYPFCMYIK